MPGCKKEEAKPAVPTQPGDNAAQKPADNAAEAKHEAHHGGCLNAIETCAVGHAEVKLTAT